MWPIASVATEWQVLALAAVAAVLALYIAGMMRLRAAGERASVPLRSAILFPSLALILLSLLGCQARAATPAEESGGDAQRGAGLIRQFGCGACHSIPGIENADSLTGPPLDHFGRRIYIAGVLRNTPGNLALWIRNPQKIVPGNVMPDVGVDARDARDIAAYLEALK